MWVRRQRYFTAAKAEASRSSIDHVPGLDSSIAAYWAPGHAPEALEDSEYVDFSPTHEFQRVLDHLTGAAAAQE